MSKSLIITEKPSVAMEFAKALKMSAKRNNGYLEDDRYIVTWCRGHLIEMCYPESYNPDLKKWEMETLPFLPNQYRYQVIEGAKEQYNVVAKQLNRGDVSRIYYAGDSAREGEYIQRLVRMVAGYNRNAEEYRVWIDSQTEEEILRGIREAKPLREYDALSDSAYARAIEDYLVGMNFSRALSLKYARLASNAAGGSYHAIAVGRVMSCVLGMIVERERLIRNTKQVSFYSIQCNVNGVTLDWKITENSPYFHSPDNYNSIGLLSPYPVTELVKNMSTSGLITIMENKESASKKNAPLLFNLAELQSECTKLFKLSPSETLAIAQNLYEKKLTTYPRTDARVLTTAMTKVYHNNISGLCRFAEVFEYANEVLRNNWHDPAKMCASKYVNDDLVSDHYAIIPTGQGIDEYASLPELEKKVFLLICRRFLSIFYPEAVYQKRLITAMTYGETFTGSFSTLRSEGYLKVAGYTEKSEEKLAYQVASQLNGTMPATFSQREGKSKPPSRYTTGSMILAMENAGKLIEDAELREQIKGSGIGTSATRAEVISKLERIQYIKVDKKTQTITPDMFGEIVYDVLKHAIPQILIPEYTANWERELQNIAERRIGKDHYLREINEYVRNGVMGIKNNDLTDKINESIVELQSAYPNVKAVQKNTASKDIQCPICGKPLAQGAKNFYCTGYKAGCKFVIWKSFAGKNITEAVVKDIVKSWNGSSGTSKMISGFSSKAGKSFNARLCVSLQPDNSVKTSFVFEN